MGRAMLSKFLIQFSIDGWGCVPSLFFDLRPNYGGGKEDNGDLLQKVPCMHCHTQCPWPCSRPPPTHASTSDSGLAAIQQHSQSLKMSLKCQREQQVPRWPMMPVQPGCTWEGPYHLLDSSGPSRPGLVCPHLQALSCALMNTRPWSLSSVRCFSQWANLVPTFYGKKMGTQWK